MKNLYLTIAAILIALLMLSCENPENGTNPVPDGSSEGDNPKGAHITAVPNISGISPASAEIGDALTINGSNFGANQGSNYVTVNGKAASTYLSWSKTKIIILVPSGSTPGAGNITVKVGRSTSNQYDFTRLASTPVTIGTQIWMGENLNVDRYRNGDVIPQVQDPTEWSNLTTGAWCYYNNDPSMEGKFGKMYNWYAVTDPRGLAPVGWHIPSDDEWKTLSMYLGMSQVTADSMGYVGTDEGGKLKEVGTSLWTPNTGATNSTGFTALPGGYRGAVNSVFNFYYVNLFGCWWSTTEYRYNSQLAHVRGLNNYSAKILRQAYNKYTGCSVRCIQD